MKRRKPAAKRKEDILRIRLTDEQREILEVAAEGTGLDLSAWARMTLLRAAEKTPEPQ